MTVIVAQLAKAPVLNQVKTRMQPSVSASDSVRLHKAMVDLLVDSLSRCDDWLYQLWVSKPHSFFSALSERYRVDIALQQGSDLGQRLSHISRTTFLIPEMKQLVLIGSDCPLVDRSVITALLRRLRDTDIDLVIQPALDGGYVALGVKGHHEALFTGIRWGTDEVLSQTLTKAEQSGLRVGLLEPLPDIDRPEDLKHLKGVLDFDVDDA